MSLSSAHASDLWELVQTPGVRGTCHFRSVNCAMPCNTDIDTDQQPVRAWKTWLLSPPTELMVIEDRGGGGDLGWGGEETKVGMTRSLNCLPRLTLSHQTTTQKNVEGKGWVGVGGWPGGGWWWCVTCKDEKPPLAPHGEGSVADNRGFLSRYKLSSKEKLGFQAHSTGSVPVKLLSDRVLQQHPHKDTLAFTGKLPGCYCCC